MVKRIRQNNTDFLLTAPHEATRLQFAIYQQVGEIMTNVLMVFILLLRFASKIDSSEEMTGVVDYNKLLEAQKDDKILIIDVRENSEVQETGKLPGSIHIPMKEVMNELNLSSEEFEKKYSKLKPSLDTQIITSCKLGGRSARVQSELQRAGYKNVLNYSGGWADWEKHQKNN